MNIKKALYRFGAALMTGLLFFSCAGMPKDIVYTVKTGLSSPELEAIEKTLLASRIKPGSVNLDDVRLQLQKLAETPSSDTAYSARISALQADVSLQSGSRRDALKYLERAKRMYPGDETAALVEARMTKTPEEKLALLDKAVYVCDTVLRLRAEMGSAYFALGRYREALAAFDAGLPKLGDDYRELFGAEREQSYMLRDADSAPDKAVSGLISKSTITLEGMAALTRSETSLLDKITGDTPWPLAMLYERLKTAGWYIDPSALGKTYTLRKDAAQFLWAAITQGNARMASRYTKQYAGKGKSPIPDVPQDAAYFDAALGVVEEGLIPLVDGKNFNPEGAVSGIDLYTWLQKAASWR